MSKVGDRGHTEARKPPRVEKLGSGSRGPCGEAEMTSPLSAGVKKRRGLLDLPESTCLRPVSTQLGGDSLNSGTCACKAGTLYHSSHSSSPFCSILDMGESLELFAQLASSHDPSDLSLLSSQNYRHESRCMAGSLTI
jgi:hypothetical protein